MADGTSRDHKLKEALAWESAWEQIDPTYAPTTENTFSAYQTLRKQCVDLVPQYAAEEVKLAAENTKLTTMQVELEDDCEAWYKAATKLFKPGTAEGDLIRRSVPTTSVPDKKKPAPPEPKPPQP